MRSQPEALPCEILITYSLALLKMTCQELFLIAFKKIKARNCSHRLSWLQPSQEDNHSRPD